LIFHDGIFIKGKGFISILVASAPLSHQTGYAQPLNWLRSASKKKQITVTCVAGRSVICFSFLNY
jgi:hypothetical protein